MAFRFSGRWKKILLGFVGGYVALTLIAMVIGYIAIKNQSDAIENHETDIGKEFVKKKDSFYDSFYKNSEEILDEMMIRSARLKKSSDRSVLQNLKTCLEWEIRNRQPLLEIEDSVYYYLLTKEAFNKQWNSQKEEETQEEYKRRHDEGDFDWDQIRIARKESLLPWEPEDTIDELKDKIENDKELFRKTQKWFKTFYEDNYQGILNSPLAKEFKEKAKQEALLLSQQFEEEDEQLKKEGKYPKEHECIHHIKECKYVNKILERIDL